MRLAPDFNKQNLKRVTNHLFITYCSKNVLASPKYAALSVKCKCGTPQLNQGLLLFSDTYRRAQ